MVMAMEQAKMEGCQLFNLPPRKRFKLLEKERREHEEQRAKDCHKEKIELEEQRTRDCQTVRPLCSDMTNVVRLSPNKITSKGFKVLEKRKHKELQQQQQQNSKRKLGLEAAAQSQDRSHGLQLNKSFINPPQSFLSKHKGVPKLQIHPNKENQDGFEEGNERPKASEKRRRGPEQQMQKQLGVVTPGRPSGNLACTPTSRMSISDKQVADACKRGEKHCSVLLKREDVHEMRKNPPCPASMQKGDMQGMHKVVRVYPLEVKEDEGLKNLAAAGEVAGAVRLTNENIYQGTEEPQRSDLQNFFVEQESLKEEHAHLKFPAADTRAHEKPEKENVSQAGMVEKSEGSLPAMYNHFSTMSSLMEEDDQKEIVVKCKSSYEESDWEEEDAPRRTFGMRSGITQRVHAPAVGLLPQRKEEDFSLVKIPEQEDEDEDGVLCDVCRSTDAEPSDPIVFCDGCDVGVHASCYGNPLRLSVPEGDWFCAQCLSHDPHSKTCCLCPSTEGAMKKTTDGSWAHISCAVFVPEVFFHSAEAREPINCSHVPSRRWKSVCSVCKSTGGACVECTETGCQSTFHISCGLKEDLAIDYRDSRSGAVVISFCKVHTPMWNQQQESKERVKFKIVSRDPKIGHKYKAQLHV